MPALGDAHQVLMADILAEEEKEEGLANSIQLEPVDVAMMPTAATGTIDDELSSSGASPSTHLDVDEDAIAETQTSGFRHRGGTFEEHQAQLQTAADGATRQEESFCTTLKAGC